MSDKTAKNSKKKSSYHHGQLREACIQAGLELLDSEKGRDFSLRDIARHLGVSHGAPYNHFKSKEALLAAISEQGFLLFRSYLENAKKQATDADSHFRGMGRAYIQFAQTHPHHYRMMFSDAISDHSDYESLSCAGQSCFQQLLQMVETLKEEKYFQDYPTLPTAMTIWSTMHGYCMLLIEQRTPPLGGDGKEITDPTVSERLMMEAFETMGEIMLKGLRA